jgi:hypothetical protein
MEAVIDRPSAEVPSPERRKLIDYVTAAHLAVQLCARRVPDPTRDDQLEDYLARAIDQLQAAQAALADRP